MKKSEIQIFLAHASEDKPAVFALYDRLKAAGYKPWLDKKDLIPGQDWELEISQAIANSQLVIACFSDSSVAKKGFVQQEFRMALVQYAKRPPGSIYLIPLRLDECEIPSLENQQYGLNVKKFHWVDYWEADGFEQLEKAIAHEFNFEPEEPVIIIPSKSVFNFEVVFVNARGKEIKREFKQAEYFTEDLGNGINLDMVAIPGGKFLMGTEDKEVERLCKKYDWEWFKNEKPQHQVTVQPFYMAKYPITQAQWRQIASRTDLEVERGLDVNPARFKDREDSDRRPVEQVSWDDAIEFCKRLSQLTGQEYRLPSEAEWEYACRAGTTTPFYFGETITGELANYNANYTYADEPKEQYRQQTTRVGQFPPNGFGLYDMHGNVFEWCADYWHENYEGAPNDGSPWLKNSNFPMLRGGSWVSLHHECRSAYRASFPDDRPVLIGLRIACAAPRLS